MANRSVDIGGGANNYSTLNAALVGEVATYADLVTNQMILTFNCYAFQDTTTAATGTGWTTNSSYYLKITVPAGQRHSGKWEAAGYRLITTATGSGLLIQEDYTRVEWLQAQSGSSSIVINLSASNCVASQCIANGNSAARYGIGLTNGSTAENCVAFGVTRRAFQCTTGTAYANNCTGKANAATTYYVFESVSGATGFVVTNCIAIPAASGLGFGGGATLTQSYNASTDTTPSGTGSRDSQTFTFVNESAGDFHLSSSDTGAKGYGTSTGMPTIDIDNETRTGNTYDMGADQVTFDSAPAGQPTSKRMGGVAFAALNRGVW